MQTSRPQVLHRQLDDNKLLAKLSERAIMVVNKLMRKHNYDNVYDLIHIHPKLLSDFKSYLYEYAD